MFLDVETRDCNSKKVPALSEDYAIVPAAALVTKEPLIPEAGGNVKGSQGLMSEALAEQTRFVHVLLLSSLQ